ncbi:hypothetical protein [Acidocella sp. KAb 2-4]|uniref:hypothetical protein n=1 Tax=Acidocella sp. KAb 2-4 TaxID=2885158 RepID=UPI001D09217C|nr:hypothetical protein [Acidocella sp. KAb 2-4]MCB5945625.1 hypothetical protein [Acidocella sp. KAb 2-4]
MRFSASAAALAAASLLSLAQPAAAMGFFGPTPSVKVPAAGLESQAQLATQLQAEGYSNVTLSAAAPSLADPHPELNPTETSAPAQTPVHAGWNGTAVKDGKIVQVYVTRS